MAGNYWESSHYKVWILDKQEIDQGRRNDVTAMGSVEDLLKIHIFFTNFIQSLGGEQLKLRQQVISSAIVYYRRFYSRNSLGDVDPLLLCPTCLYLAAKVEESGVIQTSNLIMRCKTLLRQKYHSIFNKEFPYKPQQIMECEFILLEMLDCCLVVFHPYRPLTQYIADLGQEDILLPTAWKIVNDTYRSDICLLYPPYLVALACIHMAAVVQKKDVKAWFTELSVDMGKILEISTLILDLYKTWKRFEEAREVPELLAKAPKPKLSKSPSPSDVQSQGSSPSSNK